MLTFASFPDRPRLTQVSMDARRGAGRRSNHAARPQTDTIDLDATEYKEAFALFDKKAAGAIPKESLGDLLRALGQNPTQAEVQELSAQAGGRDSEQGRRKYG